MFSARTFIANLLSHQNHSDTWELLGRGQWGIPTIELGKFVPFNNRVSKGPGVLFVFFPKVTTMLNIGETKNY